MIPLLDIFRDAAKSPTVQKVAVVVVAVAVALFGLRLVFGSDLRFVTDASAACEVALADQRARLDLTGKAMESCEKALDLCFNPGSPK